MLPRIIPSRGSVESLMTMLLGYEPIISNLTENWSLEQEKCYIATYCTHNKEPKVLVSIDLPLSASLSALLTRHMPYIAKESIQQSRLSEDLSMNLKEIMNVIGGQLNNDYLEHLVFQDMFEAEQLSDEIRALLAKSPSNRINYYVKVPNYYDGKLSYLAFDA